MTRVEDIERWHERRCDTGVTRVWHHACHHDCGVVLCTEVSSQFTPWTNNVSPWLAAKIQRNWLCPNHNAKDHTCTCVVFANNSWSTCNLCSTTCPHSLDSCHFFRLVWGISGNYKNQLLYNIIYPISIYVRMLHEAHEYDVQTSINRELSPSMVTSVSPQAKVLSET